jgi:hypothetical protein
MRSVRRTIGAGAAGLLLAAAVAAGCAGEEPEPMTSREPPPMSSTDLPTMRPPMKPPKKPTDLVPHDLVAGRVTRGGTGPCYGLITDDGKEYALHSTAGLTLTEGTYVRVKFASTTAGVDCGPGRQVAILTATVLG